MHQVNMDQSSWHRVANLALLYISLSPLSLGCSPLPCELWEAKILAKTHNCASQNDT